MIKHTLHNSVELPQPLDVVFEFFADAANLQRITPPELNFAILTPLPLEMQAGTLIEFKLSLFGVPFNWQTEISVWEPPHQFIDRQLTGPYAEWIHQHTFRSLDAGTTLMEDDVTYSLPSQPMGELAYPLVKKQLERIFAYRRETILKIMTATTR